MKKEANGMDWGTVILAIAMIAGELLSGDDDDGEHIGIHFSCNAALIKWTERCTFSAT